jgi:hypothetical protein
MQVQIVAELKKKPEYFVVKDSKRIYFDSYKEAKEWVQSQPEYPKGNYYIYPYEYGGSAPSTGRKAHGIWGGGGEGNHRKKTNNKTKAKRCKCK